MPRFAANLSMLYNDLDFLDRFEAAARDGFQAVEYLFPYDFAPGQLARRLQDHGLQQVLFNAPPGDWNAGERGLACIPGREAEFAQGMERAVAYAQALGCPRIHVMAGLKPAGASDDILRATYIANVRHAARLAAPHGIAILLEPINGRDMPGFFLSRQDQAHALLADIAEPNVQVQMDLYHCQIDLRVVHQQRLGGRVLAQFGHGLGMFWNRGQALFQQQVLAADLDLPALGCATFLGPHHQRGAALGLGREQQLGSSGAGAGARRGA